MGFVSGVLDKVGDAVGGIVDGAVNIVKKVGSTLDDAVHHIIPGGWAGVGSLALLSVGIADPTLLGLAEEGTLTTEALTSAGVDAAKVAQAVSTVTPEVTAATQAAVASGVTPEVIAMANATTDPIAALTAAQGKTLVDTAYLAQIGAPQALIDSATASNAALAAAASQAAGTTTAATGGTETAATGGGTTTAGTTTGGTETAATGGGTTTAGTTTGGTETAATGGGTETAAGGTTPTTTGGTETAAGGTTPTTTPAQPTTQVFDDGSTLTTHPDGSISATDSAGNPTNTLISPGGPGQAPVYDASGTAVPGTNNPLGNANDISLGTAAKDLASGIYANLGPLGTAALVGGGLLASGALTPKSNLGGQIGSGNVNYQWGEGMPIAQGPLNPGLLQQTASQPFYHSQVPTDAQYYWGAHNVINKPEDVANYNVIPSAPKTPFGAGPSAVGGTEHLNIPAFVNQYITNPSYAGIMTGTSPGYNPPTSAVVPTVKPLSQAQQAMSALQSQAITGPAVPVV